MQDFLKPDRIVVGSTDQAAAIKVSSLYLGVAAPVIVTDPASAETIKYAANAFLATKLSFVNAVAAICEGVGADVNDVVLGLGYDKRIGQDFLRPGPGLGWLAASRRTRGRCSRSPTTPATRSTCCRASSPSTTSSSSASPDKVVDAAGGDVAGKTIGVWGLTFKARTDDLRESPSIAIIERLLAKGAKVQAHDPTVDGPKPGLPDGIEVCADPYAAAEGADVLVVLTEWDDYRWLDAGRVAAGDGRARRRRRPQPARPQRVPARRVRATPASGADRGPHRRHRRRRLPRLAPVPGAARPRRPGRRRRQPHHRLGQQHRGAVRPPRLHVRRARRQPVRVGPRCTSTRSCTSPARRRRSTSSASRSRSSRSAASARTTASAWPRPRGRSSSSPRRARSTATRRSTRSRRRTGATSTRSAHAASTTRPSASPRR